MTDFIVYSVLNLGFALLVSPLFMGIVKKVKALAQGRQRPPLLQQYYNLAKLLKKEVIYSSDSSWVMRTTPYINLAAMLTAALSVPLVFIPQPTGYMGNIILFLYLLALAKFFMALSGLDAASTFGGMGSSREMAISAVIEPITIIVFGAMALVLNTTSIEEMFRQTAGSGLLSLEPALLPLSIALFIVLIVETSRVPVDNPETHLELTMVHEAMVLEQSGKNLAMMEASHAVKQALLMAILINIFVPWGISTSLSTIPIVIGMASFLVKGSLLAAFIGLFESSMAKLRLFRLPGLFLIAFFLSLITILLKVFS